MNMLIVTNSLHYYYYYECSDEDAYRTFRTFMTYLLVVHIHALKAENLIRKRSKKRQVLTQGLYATTLH